MELIDLTNNVTISNDLTRIVGFPTLILEYDSHSLAHLDLFISSDPSIFTSVFPSIGKFWNVVSVSIDFPLNSKRCTSFDRTGFVDYLDDLDVLRDQLRDSLSKDIFKSGAYVAAVEFFEFVQVRIHVQISDRIYQVKSHSSPWFSAAGAAPIAHRSHFFLLYQRLVMMPRKWMSDRLIIVAKELLKLPDLLVLLKANDSVYHFPKKGYRDFWRIANNALQKSKSVGGSEKLINLNFHKY